MKNAWTKIAAGILAVTLLAAAPVKAGLEGAAAASREGVSAAVSPIKDAITKWVKLQKRRIKNNETTRQCPVGTHPSYEGELGLVCRSDKPASVTCEIIGWQPGPGGEGAPDLVPVLGKCTPEGGWAGPGPGDAGPQAP